MLSALNAVPALLYATPFLLVVLLFLLGKMVKILREYERAVVFNLGRFYRVKGPGLVLLLPFVQEMVRVDLRIQVIEISTQGFISCDNVSMNVDAVLYFNVADAEQNSTVVFPMPIDGGPNRMVGAGCHECRQQARRRLIGLLLAKPASLLRVHTQMTALENGDRVWHACAPPIS